MGADIRFPHLGIVLQNVGKSISIGGFSIAYYGMIIAIGMIVGILLATWQAKRLKMDAELISDLAICVIISAVLGARLYYVVFQWDYYGKHPLEIFDIRGGGLAIYGGILAGVLAAFIFAKIRKVSFLDLIDAACAGLLIGQILGRWGNFFNREAFGGYTDAVFAMQIKRADVREWNLTKEILNHLVTLEGTEYIQVHPTFFYESAWNLMVLLAVLLLTGHRRFSGQLFLTYLGLYGFGRFWIEGLRTDQLRFFGTGIAVSQALSAFFVIFSIGMMIYMGYMGKMTEKKDTI